MNGVRTSISDEWHGGGTQQATYSQAQVENSRLLDRATVSLHEFHI